MSIDRSEMVKTDGNHIVPCDSISSISRVVVRNCVLNRCLQSIPGHSPSEQERRGNWPGRSVRLLSHGCAARQHGL